MVTVTMDPQLPPPPAGPAASASSPPEPPAAPPPRPVPPAPPPGGRAANLALLLPGTALSILAVLALALVAHLTAVSQLQYQRNQQTAFANFRGELARGTAPVGQYQVDHTQPGAGREKLVNPGTAMAVLRIPAIGLQAVVFEGTSGDVLRSGPGHRRDSVFPGQPGTSIIMGRRAGYGGPFRDLDLLIPGDLISVVTGQSERPHTYRVRGLRRPGDEVPPPPAAGAGRLTLVTALGSPFVPEDMLRVDADLVSDVQAPSPRKFGAASLPAPEQAMATDAGAWTPLMLWTQALCFAALAVTYLRNRLGRWHAWIIGVPVLAALALAATDQVARLLPNLL